MALLSGWPSITDDTGGGQDGTPADKSWADAVKASIEDQVHSSTNTTIKPKDIIDEVKTARGSTASLDARLDVSLNEDGTPKPVAGQAALTDVQGFIGRNLLVNPDFQIWPAGDAAAPASWRVESGTPTLARVGTGLGDTDRKIGDFCLSVTNSGDVMQVLLSAAAFARADVLKSRNVSLGCWVKTAISSHARVYIDDGVTQGISDYHTGSGDWEFLRLKSDTTELVHQLSGTANKLECHLQVTQNGEAKFSGPTFLIADHSPLWYVPPEVVYGAIVFSLVGELAVVTEKDWAMLARPFIVKDVQIRAKTAPTGAAAIFDVNAWDGSAWQSMFSTKPQLAISSKVGNEQPDGTYRYRCFAAGVGDVITNAMLGLDIDQIGSTIKGSDVRVFVRAMQYITPLEAFRDYNEVG